MAFKRALWTSGYEYRMICPYCGFALSYTDRQLDYRSWYPNGFVYCPRCRKPLRHSEIYAVHPDGTRVYNNQLEADQAIRAGYFNATGINLPPQGYQGQPQEPQPQPAPQQSAGVSFCPDCGRQYNKGEDRFCSGCGKKLD